MESNHDIYLMLGKLEGKVDTLVQLQTTSQTHLDAIEARLDTAEQTLAVHNGQVVSNKVWLSNLYSTLALLLSAVGAYLGWKF
jgi:hypothetical protein